MSTDENKAIARRWIESSWTERADEYEDVVAPDAVFHRVGGPAEILSSLATFRGAVSNLEVTIGDQIAEGDRVATRWSVRGTQTGELLGVPATGKEVTYSGITIERFVDGRIVEDWFESDLLGLMRQIGA